MSNYSINESSVRVDLFRPSGKWYDSVAICEADFKGCSVEDSVKAVFTKLYGNRYQGMTLVCLNPYHEHSCPVMFVL
jgi:hypothetical protein